MNKKILLISVIIFAIDQMSKAIVDITLKVGQSIPVIKNFFYITYYHNTGAAWGILNNRISFLVILSFVILLIIYRYMYSFKLNKRNTIAFGLLIGGIFGNLVDRIIFGHVKDFFDIYIFNYNYPIFNISDCAIVIGIVLLVIAVFKGEEVNGKNSSRTNRKKDR